MKIISGIQQLGVGVPNVGEAWAWYRKAFGMNIRIFEDEGIAELMLPYTGGKPQNRHAALALNMQGGGGFEIWQYTTRTPQAPTFEIQTGDLGFFAGKIRCKDVPFYFEYYKAQKLGWQSKLYTAPDGSKTFYVKDSYNNIFQIIEFKNFFSQTKFPTGGVAGVQVGVSNIETSFKFYSTILGYDRVLSDKTGTFEDFSELPSGNQKFRRMLLGHSKARQGAFSRILGESQIELIQALDRQPQKIFTNRFWGDLGFIHLCYDVANMDIIKKECAELGCAFTVDTGASFDMGAAAGRFAYCEDPDGALIEFVETFKVPVFKKFGIFISLKNRDKTKSLPNIMIKALGLNKVK